LKPTHHSFQDFYHSALCNASSVSTPKSVQEWWKERHEALKMEVRPIPFHKLNQWYFEDKTGNLIHISGKFFSIEGIRVQTDFGFKREWDQPIISQPEIGFLGILTKKIDGILHFLMQAKAEPGNIDGIQLSPTIQATKSNYKRVHQGSFTPYLDYFQHASRYQILLDQLQSEQGARFLKKRNRNIIIEVNESEEIPVYADFCWMTLGQILDFTRLDNRVNMDTRTILSGIPIGEITHGDGMTFPQAKYGQLTLLRSSLSNEFAVNSADDVISWITHIKTHCELEVEKIPLKQVKGWKRDANEIYHQDRKYFSIISVQVAIYNREVSLWDQPLFKPAQEGIIAFLIKKIGGVYHFLVQAKLEAGNFDIIELAPTVQCLTGNYRKGVNEYEVPFLDLVLNADRAMIWYDTMQSEEGGRFYKEQNRNMVIELHEEIRLEIPNHYIWMTLPQLKTFLKYNNYLNIAARNLISVIQFS
jgi:oxidase EvaA